MRARSDDGVELNAEFGVEPDDGRLSLVLESAGGKVPGSRHSRNHDYVPVLRLLLSRLQSRRATLVSAVVASSHVSGLAEDQRMLVRGPLELAQVVDVEALRREITTPKAGLLSGGARWCMGHQSVFWAPRSKRSSRSVKKFQIVNQSIA